VSIGFLDPVGYWHEPGGVLSPDGTCRAFDGEAAGTVGGNGVGIVVLRRLGDALADGHRVRAIIRGTAMNNDGAAKAGFTAPSAEGQAAVIAEALAVAEVEPESVDYIEAHGTGTPLGDPIELTALGSVFSDRGGAEPLLIGSVKPNVGHLDAASGVVGLIKTVLAIEAGTIPPSINVTTPTSRVDTAALGLEVNTRLRPWPERPDGTRIAGVSSFGIGGTNVHVVVESAPRTLEAGPFTAGDGGTEIVVLSAAGGGALDCQIEALRAYAKRAGDSVSLRDVAAALWAGRAQLTERAALVCEDIADLGSAGNDGWLRGRAEHSVAVFLFPGQGVRYAGAVAGLYATEPVFRAEVDRCAEPLSAWLPVDVRDLLLGRGDHDWSQTLLAQPALFVLEYALARLWESRGVRPIATVGHSVGEFVSACLAGVLEPHDALRAVTWRGRLLQESPPGAMLAARLTEETARQWTDRHPKLSVAAVNGPADIVFSGPGEAIAALEQALGEADVPVRRLATSRAFHSPVVEPAARRFTEMMTALRLSPPRIPFISTVTGDVVPPEVVTDPEYWGRQVREPVRFGRAIARAAALDGATPLLIEVGPGRTLTGHVRRVLPGHPVVSSLPHPDAGRGPADDRIAWLRALAVAWTHGLPVEPVERVFRRLSLPTYPFEPERHWPAGLPTAVSQDGLFGGDAPAARPPADPEPASEPTESPATGDTADVHDEVTAFMVKCWEELLGVSGVGPDSDFFELGGESLLGIRLLARIRDRFGVRLTPSQLFDAPKVRELADVVREQMGPPDKDEVADLIGELIRLRGGSDV
jgi:phthiocerol/phenolphthiocerol synthesis type-I polyketide synthase E